MIALATPDDDDIARLERMIDDATESPSFRRAICFALAHLKQHPPMSQHRLERQFLEAIARGLKERIRRA